MKPVYLTEAAISDVEVSMEWYDYQQIGLGNRFYKEIVDSLNRISQSPSLFVTIPNHNVRRGLPQVFPYAIYYREESDRIIAIAILHQRMDFDSVIKDR